MQPNTKRILAWIFIPLLVLLLLLLILAPLAKNQLKQKIAEQLQDKVQYSLLEISLLSRSATLSDLKWTGTKNGDTSQIGSAAELYVGGLDLISYFFGDKQVELKKIEVKGLSLKNYAPENDTSSGKAFKPSDLLGDQLQAVRIKSLSVRNSEIQWFNQEGTKLAKVHGIDLSIREISLDSASAAKNNGWFSTESMQMQAEGTMLLMGKKLHKLKTGKIRISSETAAIEIDSVAIVPLYAKNELAKFYGYQTNWISAGISRIVLSDFDLDRLIYHSELTASRADIEGFDYKAFREKAYAYHPDRQTVLPHLAFQDLVMPVSIDTLIAKNARFLYEEHVPPANQNGEVFFSNVDIYISNFSNTTEKGIKMHATADLFGKAKLTADFSFPMDQPSGIHYVKGNLAPVDLQLFNQAFEPLAFFYIKSGQLKQLDFNFQADSKSSIGDILFQYENLKIKLLDKENLEKSGFLKDIGSFLANKVVLHTSNTANGLEEKEDKAKEISFERDTRKSIFNYWWKSLFSGMKNTVMRVNLNMEEEEPEKKN